MSANKYYLLLFFILPAALALILASLILYDLLTHGIPGVQPAATSTPWPTFAPVGVTPAEITFFNSPLTSTLPAMATASPTGTATPSPTPAPPPSTPTSETVSLTFLQDMNIRTGPSTAYPITGSGQAGESAQVVGRSQDGTWLQIEYNGLKGRGWVFAGLVQVNGNPGVVVIAQAPPLPPTATPLPTPLPPPPPTPEKSFQFTPTGWYASPNAAIVHFKGRILDEQGNPVNGFSVLLDNWSWSVLSHPSGPSRHYPNKGEGEWDVSIPKQNLKDGVGWWYLTVVRYECSDFNQRFDAQCKQFTRLSEDIKIQVVWPDETVINADWVCHWDCESGLR